MNPDWLHICHHLKLEFGILSLNSLFSFSLSGYSPTQFGILSLNLSLLVLFLAILVLPNPIWHLVSQSLTLGSLSRHLGTPQPNLASCLSISHSWFSFSPSWYSPTQFGIVSLNLSLLVLFLAILVLPNPFGSPSHFFEEIQKGHVVVVTFVEEGVRVATHHHIHSLHTPRYVSIDGQPGMADSDDLVDSLLK